MRKILGLTALTLTLGGLTGCSIAASDLDENSDGFGVTMDDSGIEITGEGFGQDADYFGEMSSYGVYADALFGKLNELNPNLKINLNEFEELYYDIEGGSYLDGYVSTVSDGVAIYYSVLTDDEWSNLKDESSAGMVDAVALAYNKANPGAVEYALQFSETFNRIVIENHLNDQAHELSEGFNDCWISITQNVEYDEEDLDEEMIKTLEMLGADSLADIATISF